MDLLGHMCVWWGKRVYFCRYCEMMWCNMFVMSTHGKLTAVIMSLWITTPKISPWNSKVINLTNSFVFRCWECMSSLCSRWYVIKDLTSHQALTAIFLHMHWLVMLVNAMLLHMQRHYKLCVIEKKYYPLFWKMAYVDPFPHYFLTKVWELLVIGSNHFSAAEVSKNFFALRATYIRILGEVLWYTEPSVLVKSVRYAWYFNMLKEKNIITAFHEWF